MDATVNVGITEEGVPALIELRLTQDGQTLRAALELAVTDHDVTYYLVLQIDEEEYCYNCKDYVMNFAVPDFALKFF